MLYCTASSKHHLTPYHILPAVSPPPLTPLLPAYKISLYEPLIMVVRFFYRAGVGGIRLPFGIFAPPLPIQLIFLFIFPIPQDLRQHSQHFIRKWPIIP